MKMNTNNTRQNLNGCLAVGLIALLSAGVQAQTTTSNWANTEPGGGDWADFNNWEGLLIPLASFNESANIGNGGTALVVGPVSSPGGIKIPNGTVEIRNGGVLASTAGNNAGTGAVRVGQGTNDSHLRVLGGGSFSAPILTVNAGSADTSVELSGDGSLTVTGNTTLGRTTRITGNAATFNVGGDLTIGGNFISEITDPTTHSAINVVGGVTIDSGAILNLDFGGGVTPSSGDSWPLVSGSTGITGGFSSIVGPALGGGLGYKASGSGGDLSVSVISVSSLMALKVNRTTGAASINGGTEPIDMELYAIGSPGGHLTPGTWVSLDVSGFDNDSWRDGNPSGNANGLAEARANPLGSSTIGIAQSQSIGSILNTTGLTVAESREDLTFSYLEPGSTIFTNGIVEYEGPHNNLVLVVDPDSGDALIHNQSAFDATINLYAISSDSGSLFPDMSETVDVGWDSFQETGVDGGVWERGPGSAEVLVDANPASATTISSGTAIGIGSPWDRTTRDLTFQFLLEGDSAFTRGIVEYGPLISPPIDGDYDASGQVALGDLNLVLFNWNQDGGGLPAIWVNQRPDPGMTVGLPELNDVLFNWGNTSSIATVPEPASMALVWIALFAACSPGWKHRR
jgi:hypothetical protein